MSEEREKVDARSPERDDERILGNFLQNGRLKTIPAKQKKRAVILRFLAEQFELDRMYEEAEVNQILVRYHEDFAALRRYLVDSGLLTRQVVRVVEAKALMEAAPEIQYKLTYWRPGPP